MSLFSHSVIRHIYNFTIITAVWFTQNFQKCEIFDVCVFYSFVFLDQLLPDLDQVLALVEFLNCLLHSFKAEDQGSDIVQWPRSCCCSDNDLYSISSSKMLVVRGASTFCLCSVCVWFVSLTLVHAVSTAHFIADTNLFCDSIPYFVHTISIVETLEDAVATNHDKIEVVLYFERGDVRFTNDYIWVATVLGPFGFNVTKCFRNTKPSREHSKRSLHVHVFLTWLSRSLRKCLRSIYLAACSLDSDLFKFIVRLVISREDANLLSWVNAHEGSRVANIDNIDHIIYYHDHIRTRPWSFWTNVLSQIYRLGSCLSLLNEC